MKSPVLFLPLLLLVPTAMAGEVDYQQDIRPLLLQKCSACHGAIKQEAGLRLDAGKLIYSGGDNGPVINLNAPSESMLLERVVSTDADFRMPPQGEGEPLKPGQIELLSNWISAGARYPDDEAVPAGPKSHWAYRPPVQVTVPEVDNAEWSANPIDAFIYAKLQHEGLEPARLADRRTLLRRVYLDLIGLPPTSAEQETFLNDDSPDAWLRVVDRLLADPAYGERWGRHWMDVWRYSDWDGYKQELRGSQRHIWRWRDWIIESLNKDKPYDRMVVEMLAGDEVAPEDRSALRATGYLARSYHKSNRDIWLDATVEHTAKAFLGMTINCARCHDHKYDPIGQREYYAMRAIFEPHNVRTERVPGEADIQKDGFVRAFDAQPAEPTYLYIGGNEKSPDKKHPIAPNVPQIIGLSYKPQAIALPPVAVYPALREFYKQESLVAARNKINSARDAFAKLRETDDEKESNRLALQIAKQRIELAELELASVEARWNADKAKHGSNQDEATFQRLAKAASTAERTVAVASARLTVSERKQDLATAEASVEADAAKKQPAIDKAKTELEKAETQLASALESLSKPNQSNFTSFGKSYPVESTGRRLALAKWITSSRNPLTARVAVNHIWLRHFGEPLVGNVFDFGMRSPEPVHRELLDWLAVEFMDSGWSMKHLHRLIVTSRFYQCVSAADRTQFMANYKRDPDNKLLWKANVRRLDAEVVRDSILSIAGTLDRKLGGPDIDHNEGASVARRSLYFRHAYEKQMRLLVTFDAAAPSECYRRSESVVPQQALALLNGSTAIEQARTLSRKLSQTSKSDDAFVRSAFIAVLCRDCTDEERLACSEFLASQAELLSQAGELKTFDTKTKVRKPPASDPSLRARENLIHVLFNHNDFVTVR